MYTSLITLVPIFYKKLLIRSGFDTKGKNDSG